MPGPNVPPTPSPDARFEKLYTLSAIGLGGNSFTYTLIESKDIN